MIVFHRTTYEAKASILADRTFISRERGEVCVSDHEFGHAEDYGDAVVTLDIPDALLDLDDEFPSGERHYRVLAKRIKPHMILSD